MDGYALHAADLNNRDWLEIIGEQAAGPRQPMKVVPGKCVRIFTGAPLPEATGAVIMQEDMTAESRRVRFTSAEKLPDYQPGEFIRRRGSDLAAGQCIVRAGERLQAGKLGVIASQGFTSVSVGRQPRVAILSTGSELRAVGESLRHEGEIYNSNGPLLAALVAEGSLASAISTHHVEDQMAPLQAMLERLLATHEVVMIAGGVSVGDHDLVKPALNALGVTTDFWRVAVKPGKPFLYGRAATAQVFGLPGNPVSAFVTAVLFVLPALRKLAGAADPAPRTARAILAGEWTNWDQRPTYFRGQFEAATGLFRPFGLQESHALFSLSQANALLPVPPQSTLPAGSEVQIIPLHAAE